MDPTAVESQPCLTGLCDPVLDFIQGAFGKLEANVLAITKKNLRWMIEKFATCQGQFFLFVKRYFDSCGRPRDENMILITDVYLCIISRELRFGEAGTPFRFPIKSPYAVGNSYREPTIRTGRWFDPTEICGYEIMQYVKEPKQVSDVNKDGIDMAIGDEEVKDLIRQYQDLPDKHRGEFPLLAPVCKMSLLLKRILRDLPEQDELLKKDNKLFAEFWEVMRK